MANTGRGAALAVGAPAWVSDRTRAPNVTPARPRSRGVEVGVAIVAILYVAVVAAGIDRLSYTLWGALAVAPVLTMLTWALARRMAAAAGDPTIARLVMLGWGVKMGGILFRWWTAYGLYDKADARAYNNAGEAVADVIRSGSFDFSGLPLRGGGTRVIEIATGAVYAVTGATSIGGFLVFGWFAFLGILLCWRAFALAVPSGDARRYGFLLVLLPSLVYWPSSLGKESWMTFGIGLAAYGAARVLTHRRGGLVLFAAGAGWASLVRSHISLLLIVTLTAAFLLGRTRQRPGRRLLKLLGAAALIGACVFAFGQLQDQFALEGGAQGVEDLLNFTEEQTGQGSSEFSSVRVRTPLDLPAAVVTVFFRPFPFEANNAQAFGAALEGVLVAGLCVMSWRRLVRVPGLLRREPYLLFCLAGAVGFVIAFSTVGNFGILARQRVQALPFVLALLALRPSQPAPDTSAPRWARAPVA